MENNNPLQTNKVETLQYANFENAKKHLQAFSKNSSSNYDLDKVETDGGFLWLGDHKVTGTELNNVTSQIQGHLIKINSVNKDLIKEFGQVYTALESLDREYIPAIMSAVKGAEIASEQAKNASEHAELNQQDIKETVDKLKKVVKILENHKEKLNHLKHLENIDELWNESKGIEEKLKKYNGKFEESKKELEKLDRSIKSLQKFANSILDYDHLEEIDETWESVRNLEGLVESDEASIEEIKGRLEKCIDDIDSIADKVANINQQEHILDIDKLWADVSSTEKQIKETQSIINTFQSQLEEQKHLYDIDFIWESIQSINNGIVEINNDISERDKNNQKEIESTRNELITLKAQDHIMDVDLLYEQNENMKQEIEILKSANESQKNQMVEIQNMIAEERVKSESVIEQQIRKIKISYGVAGVGLGLALVEFILAMVGVL